jgi:hypothetical protein
MTACRVPCYQAEPAERRIDCAGSSRTTGTTKACEAELRRTVVARTVIAGLSVLVAGLAEAAARRAVGVSGVGVH